MNHFTDTPPPPQRVLLATDLGPRTDRALDRAAGLAQAWHAELLALNVLDPAASADHTMAWAAGADDRKLMALARRQLERDLAGLPVRAGLLTARGSDVAAVVREQALAAGAGLVVTGVARLELLGRFLLGSTVERLARMLPAPLLVVRQRARAPYRRIVVGTDFSDASRGALRLAASWFPGAELALVHAHEPPGGAPAGDALAGRQPGPPPELTAAQQHCARWLAAVPLPRHTLARPVVLGGRVGVVLPAYARDHEVDLVVVAGSSRDGLARLLLGSTAARLLDQLPCDTLVVRLPPPAGG